MSEIPNLQDFWSIVTKIEMREVERLIFFFGPIGGVGEAYKFLTLAHLKPL